MSEKNIRDWYDKLTLDAFSPRYELSELCSEEELIRLISRISVKLYKEISSHNVIAGDSIILNTKIDIVKEL